MPKKNVISRKRRTHFKSRSGCQECKRRHVKCDEQLPQCGICERYSVECSLNANPKPNAIRQSATISPQPSRPGAPVLPVAYFSPSKEVGESAISFMDLELYHDFIVYDCREFFRGVSVSKLYPSMQDRERLVEDYTGLALEHDYLTYAQLAVSALRRYTEDESRTDYRHRATFLLSTALALAKPHLTDVLEDHSISMLFFAAQVGICGLVEGALDSSAPDFEPVSKLVACFQLVRGVKTVLMLHWNYIEKSWAGPLLQLAMTAGVEQPDRYGEAQRAQQRTLRTLAFGLENRAQRQACLEAIDSIFKLINTVPDGDDRLTKQRLVQSWPTNIDSVVETMLVQQKPVAIVVLAHYAVLLALTKEVWWVERWPILLLEHAERQLGDEWAEFLTWPRQIICAV